MNERIQELYKQADKFAKENLTQNIGHPGNNYFELFHEKFAQLIVRECTNMLPEDSVRNTDGVHMFYVIREHFGVSAIGR